MDNYELGKHEMGIVHEVYESKTEKTNKFQLVRFDSCQEMIDKILLGKEKYNWAHRGDSWVSRTDKVKWQNDRSDEWNFGQLETYSKTMEFLKEGKVLDSVSLSAQKIREELNEMPEIKELLMRSETFKRRKQYKEEGSELCIDRVLCGDPVHWQQMTRGKKNTLVKIGVNVNGLASQEESRFNKTAATCGVITDILTRAGFAVELYGVSTSSGSTKWGGINTTVIKLKSAEDQVDLNRIYSIGCVGFFRCWVFQVRANIMKGAPDVANGRSVILPKECYEKVGIDYSIDNLTGDNDAIMIRDMFNTIISEKI